MQLGFVWHLRRREVWGNETRVWEFSTPKASLELYRKIPKISPGAYIFQRPFLRGLFLEGLLHGGAYFRNFTVPLFSSEVQWRVIGCSAAQSKCGRENRKIRLPYNFRASIHSRPALLSLVRGERIYETFMIYLKAFPFLTQETCIFHREKHLKPMILP